MSTDDINRLFARGQPDGKITESLQSTGLQGCCCCCWLLLLLLLVVVVVVVVVVDDDDDDDDDDVVVVVVVVVTLNFQLHSVVTSMRRRSRASPTVLQCRRRPT